MTADIGGARRHGVAAVHQRRVLKAGKLKTKQRRAELPFDRARGKRSDRRVETGRAGVRNARNGGNEGCAWVRIFRVPVP